MVSPGTHLVKNHESQFKKKKRSPRGKMLGCLCNQIVNLETDAKTLYYTFTEIKI